MNAYVPARKKSRAQRFVLTGERDDVEGRPEDVRGDRNVGQWRMRGLARPTAQPLNVRPRIVSVGRTENFRMASLLV